MAYPSPYRELFPIISGSSTIVLNDGSKLQLTPGVNAAPLRSEVNTGRVGGLPEIGRVHRQNGAAHRAIAADAIGEDWPQQSGVQICLHVDAERGALASPGMQGA